jgi:hypothetical protein
MKIINCYVEKGGNKLLFGKFEFSAIPIKITPDTRMVIN